MYKKDLKKDDQRKGNQAKMKKTYKLIYSGRSLIIHIPDMYLKMLGKKVGDYLSVYFDTDDNELIYAKKKMVPNKSSIIYRGDYIIRRHQRLPIVTVCSDYTSMNNLSGGAEMEMDITSEYLAIRRADNGEESL